MAEFFTTGLHSVNNGEGDILNWLWIMEQGTF